MILQTECVFSPKKYIYFINSFPIINGRLVFLKDNNGFVETWPQAWNKISLDKLRSLFLCNHYSVISVCFLLSQNE